MASVTVVEAGERLAVGQTDPPLGSFQGLDRGLLIHRQDQGVFRWLQIEAEDVGGLGGKGGIGRDAPTPPPTQRDPLSAQYPPHVVFADITQRLGQQMPRPSTLARRGRVIQLVQHAPFGVRVVAPRLARARAIAQSLQAALSKTLPPFRHPRGPRPQPSRDLDSALPLARQQNDLGSFRHPLLGRSSPEPLAKNALFFQAQVYDCRLFTHGGSLTYNAQYCN